jgi:hypothetical protein
MTKMKLLAAAAVVSGLIATPVLAQDSMHRRAQMNQQYTTNNVDYRAGDRSRDDGFWPGEVAAGVVGGAVGAAGAIANAPFQPWGNSWDNSYNSSAPPRDSYAQRMGFVCEPGTLFRGEDGRRHICQ